MRVIAKSRLRFFWESHSDRADAEKCLAVWYKIASSARWVNFASLKQTFGSAGTAILGDGWRLLTDASC